MSAGIQTGEVRCGNRRVFWGAAAAETDLGITEEGSVLRITQLQHPIKNETYGDTPITFIDGGHTVEVDLILSQWDNTQLDLVLPGSTSSAGDTFLGAFSGRDLGANDAKRLWLHPIQTTDTTDQTDAIILHKVVWEPVIEARFNNREPHVIGLKGKAIVDTTQSDGQKLIQISTT